MSKYSTLLGRDRNWIALIFLTSWETPENFVSSKVCPSPSTYLRNYTDYDLEKKE